MILNVLVEDPGAQSGWLALEDPASGLRLGAQTLAQSAAQVKRVEASNPLVPGTYTVRAVPDNSSTLVEVQVFDGSSAERERKVAYLASLFTRASYRIRVVVDEPGTAVEMVAMAADWQTQSQREFMHAGLTVVTFSFTVLPGKEHVVLLPPASSSVYGYSVSPPAGGQSDAVEEVRRAAAESADFPEFRRRLLGM